MTREVEVVGSSSKESLSLREGDRYQPYLLQNFVWLFFFLKIAGLFVYLQSILEYGLVRVF